MRLSSGCVSFLVMSIDRARCLPTGFDRDGNTGFVHSAPLFRENIIESDFIVYIGDFFSGAKTHLAKSRLEIYYSPNV